MKKTATLMLTAALLCSCNLVNNLVHDDQVVAKAAGAKLYRSQLAKYIPDGIPGADSAKMAEAYIKSWATNVLFLQKAENELTKDQRDVSAELEDYRQSLLKYRYEQLYIADRLDTNITSGQVQDFYDAHKESFLLTRPILKMRFVNILKESQNRGEILDKLSAEGGREEQDLDSLAYVSAIRYVNKSNAWTDAALVAREFGTDWETMLSRLKDGYIVMESSESADVRAAFVFDIIRKGTAPLEFCEPQIRENILSSRKRSLLTKLEQDLLTEAKETKGFVIFDE